MHVAINAQLLHLGETYRGAGVSNYTMRLLRGLGALAQEQTPAGTPLRVTALIHTPGFHVPGVTMQLSAPVLEQPLRRILWEQTALPRVLERLDADLIHGLVNVLPLATAIPGVVTVHDLSFVRAPETLPAAKRLYLTAMCRAGVGKARRVIAVSRQTADDLMHLFNVPAAKIAVIHNGVGSEFMPQAPAKLAAFRRARALPEHFWLYLGTLEPRKNLVQLVKAYAIWRQQQGADHPMKLVLAGAKGWFYDAIFQRVTELGLEDAVLFPGFIPADELPAWYGAAQGFIYPSLFEGFGLPVVEAMACGTPVVCSTTPSLLEAAGDAALTVPPDDLGALVDALARLAEDGDLRAELRRRGLAQAKRFSWLRAAHETAAVYAEVLQSQRR